MAELSPEIVADVVKMCEEGASEAAEALGRALDAKLTLTVGQSNTLDMQALPDGLSGPGLVVVLTCEGTAALFVLAESSELLPSWYANPDPTGQSKLTTLAQELGMILLPEQFMPDDFKAAQAKNLQGALGRGGVATGAALVPIEIEQEGGGKGTAYLIWPAPNPATVLGKSSSEKPASKPAAKSSPKPAPEPEAKAFPDAPKPQASAQRQAAFSDLPPYSQSLLRIKLPVMVTLAEKTQPLENITELGPGSIIQFDKSCEEMLDLAVGDQRVAVGEAVKVGDKFGLRVTSILLPDERFKKMGGQTQPVADQKVDAPE
jgi:flagellar motor switch protein FliN/FliY